MRGTLINYSFVLSQLLLCLLLLFYILKKQQMHFGFVGDIFP